MDTNVYVHPSIVVIEQRRIERNKRLGTTPARVPTRFRELLLATASQIACGVAECAHLRNV